MVEKKTEDKPTPKEENKSPTVKKEGKYITVDNGTFSTKVESSIDDFFTGDISLNYIIFGDVLVFGGSFEYKNNIDDSFTVSIRFKVPGKENIRYVSGSIQFCETSANELISIDGLQNYIVYTVFIKPKKGIKGNAYVTGYVS